MNSLINKARKASFLALDFAIQELKNEITSEISLRNKWLSKLSLESDIIATGWYNPPPTGMVILAASKDDHFARFNFLSLRNKASWPSNNTIDWKEGLLYCYSSSICKESGRIADFSTTLYFGSDQDIINHFKNCYNASYESLQYLKKNSNSVSFFTHAMRILKEHDLEIFGHSTTDTATINLGHSYPAIENIDLYSQNKITEVQRNFISNSRKFINNSKTWNLKSVNSFTFEPRLRSKSNHKLPQVSLHFLISLVKDEILVQHDCEKWWKY